MLPVPALSACCPATATLLSRLLPHEPQRTVLLQDRPRQPILHVQQSEGQGPVCKTVYKGSEGWSSALRVTSGAAVLEALGHLHPSPAPLKPRICSISEPVSPGRTTGYGSADTRDQISTLFFTSCVTLNKSACLRFPRRKVNSNTPL